MQMILLSKPDPVSVFWGSPEAKEKPGCAEQTGMLWHLPSDNNNLPTTLSGGKTLITIPISTVPCFGIFPTNVSLRTLTQSQQ